MKISQIDIKDYNQFKNLTLDLTYPKGHKKEGKPLDKICFLGQSGTGKTSLLNVIRATLTGNLTIEHNYDLQGILITAYFKEFKSIIKISNEDDILWDWKTLPPQNFLEKFYLGKNKLISFPAEIITNINQILQEKPLSFESHFKIEKFEQEQYKDKQIFDFENDNVLAIWNDILTDINAYKIKELKYSQQITKALGISADEGGRAFENYKRWKKENPNPLEELAQQLNLILNKFSLAVKTSFDFKSADDLKFIEIQSIDGKDIPYSGWSTGTKQIILTMTPLFKLNTEDSIILLDEPERSLYPDIQYEIINYYTGLAPKAQLLFATHSPIIASAFEPWEIVELKFNNQGTVYQEKYYEGERHVDNYFIDPRYLRWDVILMRVFDLAVEGNEKFRNKALTQAARLETILSKLKAENKIDTEEGQKIWADYKKLATKLAWRLDEYEED
ncbi:ATP-binding protein [Candidatus Marithrix sp. Canyon 246]|uniref:ATP-binding protein n=1 Tax=Candidatus Marithrix sp. Canyon 246 TaxID=1827136 RepID=UPI00084A2464|nr:ATP-binding protein [Candidatus Marithrix sp. Canyon 246]